jgi:hydrogenase maturation protease
MRGRSVIIGVGNRFRGDDGAGLAAARAVRADAPGDVSVVELEGEATSLLEVWDGFDRAIVVDAVKGGMPAGHIYRFEALFNPPPDELFSYSTHAFGVSSAIALGRALDRLPGRLVVYGIEGASFEAGTTLTPAVERAVASVTRRIVKEVLA